MFKPGQTVFYRELKCLVRYMFFKDGHRYVRLSFSGIVLDVPENGWWMVYPSN